MKVAKGLSIVEPWPAFLIEQESAVVVSDLHIGVEEQYEREGIHIPRTTLNEMIESIRKAVMQSGAKKLILLGDVKHEFGVPEESEWYGVKKLLREVGKLSEIKVVRGNHDNYIASMLKNMNIELANSLQVGGFFLAHGHIFYEKEQSGKKVIIGHEHPTVSVRDETGYRHRFKAFLHLSAQGREIFVLPSASMITLGTDINSTDPNDLLSPFLKGRDLSNSVPYVIEPGVAVKRFPRVSYL